MLNKRVCIGCIEKEVVCKSADGLGYRDWNASDERFWKTHGEVICPFNGGPERVTFVDHPPPDWCEYAMEHFVSQP